MRFQDRCLKPEVNAAALTAAVTLSRSSGQASLATVVVHLLVEESRHLGPEPGDIECPHSRADESGVETRFGGLEPSQRLDQGIHGLLPKKQARTGFGQAGTFRPTAEDGFEHATLGVRDHGLSACLSLDRCDAQVFFAREYQGATTPVVVAHHLIRL